MLAVSRTTGGRVWAAWMWTQLDQSLSYTESCNEEVGCYCNATVERDDSRAELVLAEVDLATREVHEVFRLRDAAPHTWGLFGDFRESPRPIDMRSFGTDLAIGVRVREGSVVEPAAMRMLRVDTSMLTSKSFRDFDGGCSRVSPQRRNPGVPRSRRDPLG